MKTEKRKGERESTVAQGDLCLGQRQRSQRQRQREREKERRRRKADREKGDVLRGEFFLR